MNVWIESVCSEGWEKEVIDYFKKKKIWDKVIYKKYPIYQYSVFLFEEEIKKTSSINYMPSDMYENIYKHIFVFMDLYSRNSPLSQDSYSLRNTHDFMELFNLEVNYIYTQFKENQIDLYIIQRSPHLGIDYLRCIVAKEMGIRTLILEQSLTPNRFFYYWDYYDYGYFKTSRPLFEKEKVTIKKEYKKEWFYTRPQKTPLKKRIKSYILPSVSFRRMCRLSNFQCLLYNHLLYRRYKTNAKKYISKDVDLSAKFIYFAMHLQPEKTTSTWGGVYNDQLLAIERLSSIIPEDWYIYVKDNPAQGFFMRGEWFYKRLSLIPKVKVVSSDTNTFMLTEKSQFVSTITGTVGWEAITGGKCVLYFGWGTWYKTFPGAFEYSDNIDVNAIASYHIDHQEVEDRMSELLTKMGYGVIYEEYYEMVENFSEEQNAKDIIHSFEKILDVK